MKNTIFLMLTVLTFTACNNNSKVESKESSLTSVMSKSESDQKLIEVCKSMDGIIDADIKDDILTVRANITKEEAQKLSDGMLSEVRKYKKDISKVIVCDIGYNILGYSKK